LAVEGQLLEEVEEVVVLGRVQEEFLCLQEEAA